MHKMKLMIQVIMVTCIRDIFETRFYIKLEIKEK